VVKKQKEVIEKSMALKAADDKAQSLGFWHRKAVLQAEEVVEMRKELEQVRIHSVILLFFLSFIHLLLPACIL
jgi:hypothetical protein